MQKPHVRLELDGCGEVSMAKLHGGGLVAHSIQLSESAARTPASLAAVTDTTHEPAAAPWRPGLSRRRLALVAALAATLGLAAWIAAGGLSSGSGSAGRGAPGVRTQATSRAVPAGSRSRAPSSAPSPSAVHGARPVSVAEAPDPEESSSYPAPASVHHASAAAPAKAGEAIVAAGAPSDAEVRAELKQMQEVQRAAEHAQAQLLAPVAGGRSIGGDGTIPIPTNVPEPVQRVVAGANAIADFPYVFGGGHASFVDNAYDCSGSVSYALAAGGLLSAPETSGDLESWGVPGPGRYITVLASAGHTYMYVDGILYNTAGRSGVYASRWQVGAVDNSGYVARHWPGL